jgi:hypothetical protein
MSRLDKERQDRLQPKRIDFAVKEIIKRGISGVIVKDDNCIEFFYKGNLIKFFPYSGWHSGKGIVDGRGIDNLLKQLKSE